MIMDSINAFFGCRFYAHENTQVSLAIADVSRFDFVRHTSGNHRFHIGPVTFSQQVILTDDN